MQNDATKAGDAAPESLTLAFLRPKFSWREVADAARTTIRMEAGTKEPSSRWKRQILLAEHSPIRLIAFQWKWHDLKYWVSVHFVRHKFGIEHFVSTQRSDRTGVERGVKPQDAPVDHECCANAQALIFISRRRLCRQASPETTAAWKLVLEAVREIEPEIYNACVPECVYRGFCPEFKSCGYVKTEAFQKARAAYTGEKTEEP
ncbi:MAG: thymidylate synthase ThyX [Kiritimatiellae bacterium]|nr:thymidylate synthase ThyX [Kiritimatiellia bacterium]